MAANLSSVDAFASVQWSLITRRQLLDFEFTRTRIATLLRSGALRPVRLGVYATLGSVRCWQQDVMASILGVGEDAVASHSSAAHLWDFVHRPEAMNDVTILSDVGQRKPGVHRTTILPDDDVTTRSGIPCTSFERTLCDCTTLLSAFQLGRVLDDGLRRGDASLVRLHRCAARLDSGPNRRLGAIKELLALRDASYNPGGSAAELHVLQVIRDAGLPEPVQQLEVWAKGRRYVLDFAWPEQKLFAEYYGLAVHSGASAVAHDNARLTAMVGEDWKPLIFTDATPDQEVVSDIKNALSKAASDGAVEQRLSA